MDRTFKFTFLNLKFGVLSRDGVEGFLLEGSTLLEPETGRCTIHQDTAILSKKYDPLHLEQLKLTGVRDVFFRSGYYRLFRPALR
jgi:hypothetical protein